MGAQHRKARIVFKKIHGDPPYTCDHCDAQLNALEVVHHKDENKYNNDQSNLAAMHKGCHNDHHGIGRNHSPDTLENLRQLHLGAKRSDETRRRISQSLQGKPGHLQTAETRKKISEGQRKRWANARAARGT